MNGFIFYLFCRLKTVRHCLPVPGHSGPHRPHLRSQLVEESERRLSRKPCWRCSAVFWRSSAKPWQLCSTSLQTVAKYFSTRSAWLLRSNTNLVVIPLRHVLNKMLICFFVSTCLTEYGFGRIQNPVCAQLHNSSVWPRCGPFVWNPTGHHQRGPEHVERGRWSVRWWITSFVGSLSLK